MPGTMSQADLIVDLKAALLSSTSVFTAADDADHIRHLNAAAADLGRVRPRTLVGTITVVADQNEYEAPADLVDVKVPIWGRAERRRLQMWDPAWSGPLPRLAVVSDGADRRLWLDPAPTSAQITQFGTSYKFFYFAAYSISETASETTVAAADRHLLLLRAGAEAMLEISNRNVHKPVTLRGELAGVSKANTPAALYDQMMRAFERQAGMAA